MDDSKKFNYHNFPIIASVITIAISILVLIGWALELVWLTSVWHTFTSMKANTAISFILLGFALIFASHNQGKQSSSLVHYFSLLAFVIAFITVMQYLLRANMGLDEWLFQDTMAPNDVYPGRMSPITAMSIMFLSIAIYAHGKTKFHLSQLLACCVLIVALFHIIGYLFVAGGFFHIFYMDQKYAFMSLYGATLFSIVSVGIIFLSPDAAVMKILLSKESGGIFARRMIPLIIVIPIVVGYLRILGQREALYSFEFGLILHITVIIVLLIIFILFQAYFLNKSSKESQENERILKSILDNTSNIIFIKDLHGKYLLVNKRYEELFHIKQAEMLGKIDLDIFPEPVAKKLLENDKKVIQNKQRVFVEEEIPQEDYTHYYLSNKFPLFNEDGEMIAVGGISMDITDKKFSEQRFQEILKAMPDATLIIDHEGKIIFVNEQTEMLFGYHKDELIHQTVEMLIPEPYRNRHPVHRIDFFKNPRTRPMGIGMELFGLRKSGDMFPIEISLSPLETTEGMIAMASIRDITERKKIEKMKNEFISIVSHELRTPLTSIHGSLSLLLN